MRTHTSRLHPLVPPLLFTGFAVVIVSALFYVPASAGPNTVDPLLGKLRTTDANICVESPLALNSSTSISGALPVAKGGTGATSAAAARSALAVCESPLPLDTSTSITGVLGTAHLGTGTANATTYLRGDSSWSAVSGGIESPLALDTSTSITGALPTAKGGTGGAATLWTKSGPNAAFFTDTAAGTSAVNTIVLPSGTAPSTSPADAAQLYVADVNGGGTAGLWLRGEGGGLLATDGTNMRLGAGSTSSASGIALGYNCSAAGDYSFATGKTGSAGGYGATNLGADSFASGPYGLTSGSSAKAFSGGHASAAGSHGHAGDAQTVTDNVLGATADATPKVLTYFDWGAGYNKQILPATSTWTFTVRVSCYNTTDNLAAGYHIRGCIRRDAANDTAIIGTNVTEAFEEGAMSACDATVTADNTNEAIQVTVTGIADKSMRWHATITTSQVSFGTP